MNKLMTTFILSSLMLTACSKGFQSADATLSSATGNSSQGSGGGTTDGGTTTTKPSWDQVNVDGYPSGGAYSDRLVIYIDKVKQSLLLVLPIPAIIPILNPVDIPDAPGAYLTSYTDAQGNINLAINVPLQLVLKGSEFTPNQRLPNGDPLPFVPAGELPGFGIQFPQMPNYRIYLYVGVNVAAAFVELPDFGLPIGAIFPVKNKSKTKVVGAIGYVTPKVNYAGGMFLAAQIPDEMAVIIDDLIRW